MGHGPSVTGARRGRYSGCWSDLDLDAGRATIRQTVIVVAHHVQLGEPKTARGRRQIALNPEMVAVLRHWRACELQERLLIGPVLNAYDH